MSDKPFIMRPEHMGQLQDVVVFKYTGHDAIYVARQHTDT